MIALAASLTRRRDPARVRRGLPRAAPERLHGRRRVPLPRARGGARPRPKLPPRRASRSSASTPATCAAASRASARRRSPRISRDSRRCAATGSRSASPPTPFAPARRTPCATLGRVRGRARACRCTSTPTSSRARSRSASPSTDCGRSSCSPARAASAPRTTIVHATHADGGELDLLADAGARICVCPTTEANLGDGFLPVARVVHRSIAHVHRLATRTCASTRSKSCASSRASAAARPGRAASCPSTRCSRSARAKAPPRSGSTRGPTRTSTSTHPQLRGVDEGALYEALVFSCTGDVLRKTSDQ